MHQPWASLLVAGIERMEGRSWCSSVRGRLWIHAAAKVPEPDTIQSIENFYRQVYAADGVADVEFPEHYPVSVLLGCVNVVDCLKLEEVVNCEELPQSVRMEAQSDYCWLCAEPQKLIVPFEMRGKQGVYNLGKKTAAAALRGLRPTQGPSFDSAQAMSVRLKTRAMAASSAAAAATASWLVAWPDRQLPSSASCIALPDAFSSSAARDRLGCCSSSSQDSPAWRSRKLTRRNRWSIRAAVATEDARTAVSSKTAVENLVIIGSGPAGYTAAIYAARANLKPVVFEGYQAGGVPGGQLMTTTEVENFPGFPDGISGPDLMDRMRKQADRWGAELRMEDVEQVDVSSRPFTVKSSEREVKCHALIIATGAAARRLGLPSEHKFWSRGISACAICDGASPIFKAQELAVVGGGDTATEEALYLTKYARHVHLLVRRDELRASKAMQDRIFNNPNITVHFNTEVVDVVANEKGQMSGLLLKDSKSGGDKVLNVKGLFYGIGHRPNSQLLAGQVELDEAGYVVIKGPGGETSVEGLFAAGDLQDHEWRQAVTAAGSGCQAALAAERYLVRENLLIEFHQPRTEEVKKELTSQDIQMGFDITMTKHKGQYALRKLYHESPRLIAVLYTSPTCGPCRTLKPIFNKVIDEYDKDVHLVEIDIEEDPEIAEAGGIMGTPCVQFFKNKEKLKDFPGVKMKKDYREFIEANK